MQWVPHLSFVPFNSHLKEKADANLEQRPHLTEVRCFASISNPSQRPGRVLPWCGVSCWSFYINLWYCLEILLCFVFLLFFIWVCPVTMHCEQWGWTDHCFARQHFDSYFKNCFLWKFLCFELKRCSRLPWSESISSFDLNVAAAAEATDKCGVFENFFAFLSFQYDSPSSHTHTNSQISTSYVQHLCICFWGEQSQSCLYVGYGKIYFCNGTLSVLIGAFSWQRDTICIMQGSISNGPCIGSAANLSSLCDWGERGEVMK